MPALYFKHRCVYFLLVATPQKFIYFNSQEIDVLTLELLSTTYLFLQNLLNTGYKDTKLHANYFNL